MMKRIRYFLCFLAVTGMSITASNQDTKQLKSTSEGVFIVRAVYVDSQGVKWFGTNQGLCRYNGTSWNYFTDADFLTGNQVNALAFEQMTDGQGLWVATSEGVSLVKFDENGPVESTAYKEADGLLDDDVSDIVLDSRNGKFMGSEGGISWFHDGVWEQLIYSDYASSMVNQPVRQLDIYSDTLYIAQDGAIGRLISGVDGITGASRWDGDYGISPFSKDIRSVYIKGEEIQYFGTDVGVETHTGYSAKDSWDLLSSDNGLVDNTVISIAEDAEGGLWFGTHGGVSNLNEGVWTSYTTADGLLNDTVYDIGFDQDGSVWFGTGAGACRLKDGAFQDFITTVSDRIMSAAQMQVYYDRAMNSMHLEYRLEQQEAVSARLYNIRGMLVAQWTDLSATAGQNQEELSLPDQSWSEGLYVIQLNHGSRFEAKKVIINH